MRSFILSIVLMSVPASILIGPGNTGRGAPIASDDFESYTAGSNLNGGSFGTGWSGNWSTVGGHTTVQTKTLVDPNGNVSGGLQAARLQPTAGLGDITNFINRSFPSTTDTVYMGMLLRKEAGFDNADFLNFQVSNGATGDTNAALGVGIRNNAGNPFFARVGSSGGGNTDNATSATADTDFLLVAKFSRDGSANYNRTDLFINPPDFTEPGLADATAISGVTGLSALSLFSVRNFNPEVGDTVFIDSLRLATTFADAMGFQPPPPAAVPEPATILILSLAIAALALRGALKRRSK